MKCNKCGTGNPAGARFCGACGAKIASEASGLAGFFGWFFSSQATGSTKAVVLTLKIALFAFLCLWALGFILAILGL